VVDEKTTETSVTMTWMSAFAGGLDQTFVVEYRPVVGADTDGTGGNDWIEAIRVPGGQIENQRFTADISGLDPSKKYVLRVLSRNELGQSPYTSSVAAKTDCGQCMYLFNINYRHRLSNELLLYRKDAIV
jgi:hypothetical protein